MTENYEFHHPQLTIDKVFIDKSAIINLQGIKCYQLRVFDNVTIKEFPLIEFDDVHSTNTKLLKPFKSLISIRVIKDEPIVSQFVNRHTNTRTKNKFHMSLHNLKFEVTTVGELLSKRNIRYTERDTFYLGTNLFMSASEKEYLLFMEK